MKTKKSTNTEHVVKLAKKAGFIIWDDCSWAGNRVGKVDWSCEYDDELIKFYTLVREEVKKEFQKNDG